MMAIKSAESAANSAAVHPRVGDVSYPSMQCGVCSGSCPLGKFWDHPQQELFMMIRAGKREAVLSSTSVWMCTSCYNCIVRCPRELPITHTLEAMGGHAVKDLKDFHAVLKKAQELEDQRIASHGA